MTYATAAATPETLRESVLDLWARNFPEGSADRYEWLYERGPAEGWLLRDDRGRTVGGAGMMARTMRVGGRDLAAGQAIDLNVDREHRTAGPAVALARAGVASLRHVFPSPVAGEGAVLVPLTRAAGEGLGVRGGGSTLGEPVRAERSLPPGPSPATTEGGFDFLYGLPNAQSIPVLRRVGYEVVGPLGRWAKPLRSEGLPADGARPWLRKLRAAVAPSMLALASRETYPLGDRGLRAGVTDVFDERVDELWQSALARWSVIGERTARYLNWRFAEGPTAHRAFFVASTDERWHGYLVYHFRGRMVYVSDFLFDSAAALDVLWAAFLRRMRSEGACGVVTLFLGDEAVAQRLARFGFWRRACDWTLLVATDRGRRNELSPLLNPTRWYLTRADIDTDF